MKVGIAADHAVAVLKSADSSSALVAVDQTSITGSGGKYRFGPQGRIQRLVIPRPPDLPAKESQTITTPNVPVGCDGTQPFTQNLPSITNGFKIGLPGIVYLYTGGQEVVVADVVGGTHLKVGPTSGDTIDGNSGPVDVGMHGSKTFVSDGVSNWITISYVRHE